MKKMLLLVVCLTALSGILFAEGQQEYPARDITDIVVWGAGGGTDTINRVIMAEMAKELGLRIEPGSYNNIEIMADNPPYGKNVMLAKLDDWATANLYLQGYRQGKLEMTALAKGKK